MKKPQSNISAIMYHSVGRPMEDWKWSFLTVPWTIFEDHLRHLSAAGYQTVGFDQLIDHMSGIKELPGRSVVLSFDDGYLDNWTYVAPLLEKYSFCGTVFVNPEFVDPRDIIRKTIKDVWEGRATEKEIDVRGFMSWQELRLANEKGLLNVQSHAMSHTWYESSDEIVDFHHPNDGHFWLDWNSRPEEKSYYLQYPTKSAVDYGAPVYKHGKSLAVRRFFPDRRERDHLVEFVKLHGGRHFFKLQDWRDQLEAESESFRQGVELYHSKESQEDYLARIEFELAESKKIIEENLQKKVDYFCWPGGGYNEQVREKALSLYKGMTLSSSDSLDHNNRVGDSSRFFSRLGVPYVQLKDQLAYTSGNYLIYFLKELSGSMVSRKLRQLLKVIQLVKLCLFNRKKIR